MTATPARRTLVALPFLPKQIRVPERPLVAIGVGWVTAIVPSLLLAALLANLLPQLDRPEFPFDGWVAILLLVVFAPLLETLIMAAVLAILLRIVPPTAAVLLSSAGWGVAHSLEASGWGLVIWWPFLVFSTLYVTWRKRSLLLALAIPAAVHALQNLPPALLVASGNG